MFRKTCFLTIKMNFSSLVAYVLALLILILLAIAVAWALGTTSSTDSNATEIEHFDPENESLKPLLLSKEERQELLSLLGRFRKLSSKYFLIAGTLLGTIRYQDVLPWDDDVDIGILSTDVEEFTKLDFASQGLEITKVDFGYKIYDKHTYRELETEKHYPFVDVFVYSQTPEGTYVIRDGEKIIFANEYFEQDILFPLSSCRFGGIYHPCPAKSIKYLNRVFPGWDKEIFITHSHKLNMKGKRYKIPNSEENDKKIRKYLEEIL